MLYVFIVCLIGSLYFEREKLLRVKKNLALFVVLSILGILLGVIHSVSPYMPTLATVVENIMK